MNNYLGIMQQLYNIKKSKNYPFIHIYNTFKTNCLAEFNVELASRIIRFEVGLDVKYPVQYP